MVFDRRLSVLELWLMHAGPGGDCAGRLRVGAAPVPDLGGAAPGVSGSGSVRGAAPVRTDVAGPPVAAVVRVRHCPTRKRLRTGVRRMRSLFATGCESEWHARRVTSLCCFARWRLFCNGGLPVGVIDRRTKYVRSFATFRGGSGTAAVRKRAQHLRASRATSQLFVCLCSQLHNNSCAHNATLERTDCPNDAHLIML